MVGRTVKVLLEGRSDESDLLLRGRMETQAPDIDGHVLINDAATLEPSVGRFYNVEITGSMEYDLIGRIVRHGSVRLARKRPNTPALRTGRFAARAAS